MTDFVSRFAPSPTGYLHLGHAYSVLCVYRAVREMNGRFILRIEDMDRERCKPVFEDAIYTDLEWLGISWETPVRRQSDHFAEYERALQRLIDKDLVYRCFKTRREITDEISRAPHFGPSGPDGAPFIGTPMAAYEERSLLAEGAPFAWRLSLARAKEYLGTAFQDLAFSVEAIDDPAQSERVRATPEIFGDVVLGRKDSGTSYHLASVFDDALQGITHVIRGDDLASAAHLHVLLQALLDLPTPVYRHHKLITDDEGKKISKRNKSVTLKSLRESGADLSKLGF